MTVTMTDAEIENTETAPVSPDPRSIEIRTHQAAGLAERLPALEAFFSAQGDREPLSKHPAWPLLLAEGLRHRPYCLEALRGAETVGFLSLGDVQSFLFGRYLVSLPYLNYGGPRTDDPEVAKLLIDRAIELAERLNVKHLELRDERDFDHPGLDQRMTSKVHMRLSLPSASETLWKGFDPKVRNQIRKGQKNDFTVVFGGEELLTDFHDVFSRNMRDLGTPVYGARLFRTVLRRFPERSELCVVRAGEKPIAGALLLHGKGVTEVPSASSLREFNPANCNMLMYWNLLERAISKGQATFDFGRSSLDGNTYRFKKQWGAEPFPSVWLYRSRTGSIGEVRPDNPKYQRLIKLWQKLPVGVSKLIGPPIVRGIP